MISIRKKLLKSILTVSFIVTLLLATITYFTVREEMDEFYDANLKLVANTILATGPTANNTLSTDDDVDPKLRGEEEYLTQVWSNGNLEYSSHPFVEFPLQNKDGKGRVEFNGSKWRFYSKTKGHLTVQLAQDLKERHSVVIEIYGFLLIPIIIQFPILAGLIWMLVGFGLKPLSDVSNLIRNRNPSFLEPLPHEQVPIEVYALINELNALLARLKTALESQRQFTADAAHELRTPLTAVRLQLDILKRAEGAQEITQALNTLERGVLRSTHLAQQLLELARQEPENIEILFSTIELSTIVQECVEQALPIAKAKNIHLTQEIIDRPSLEGNASKLTVMLGNLISNAINYTPEGGSVVVKLSKEHGRPSLEVSDDGVGIPVADRQRVFDRFYRVSGTGVMGSGLGLSIVRSVADLHKAEIQLFEGLGEKGTTVRVIFR